MPRPNVVSCGRKGTRYGRMIDASSVNERVTHRVPFRPYGADGRESSGDGRISRQRVCEDFARGRPKVRFVPRTPIALNDDDDDSSVLYRRRASCSLLMTRALPSEDTIARDKRRPSFTATPLMWRPVVSRISLSYSTPTTDSRLPTLEGTS